MPLDFPNSPNVNDTFTSNGRSWKWDGTTWNLVPIAHVHPMADLVDFAVGTPATGQALVYNGTKWANSAAIPQASVSNLPADLAGKMPLYASFIGNAQNLNNYTTPGTYDQPSNAQAAAGSNYPIGLAGMLTVQRATGGYMIYQMYQTYRDGNQLYWRSWYDTWSAWVPAGGKMQYTVKITGTQNWTAPSGVTSVEVILAGGGGGGGGNAGAAVGMGGGGGSVDFAMLTVSPGTAYTITIGGGGGGGTAGANQSAGGVGGTSYFGGLWSVGGGGNAPASRVGGYASGLGGGGGSYLGNIYAGANGSAGGYGIGGGGGAGSYNHNNEGQVGTGASGGGHGGGGSRGVGNGAANSGAGGGGGAGGVSTTGGNGGSGVCIIRYWA